MQYLTDRQLEQLVEQTPDNDIKDYEDLQSGEWVGSGRGEGGGRPQEAGKGGLGEARGGGELPAAQVGCGGHRGVCQWLSKHFGWLFFGGHKKNCHKQASLQRWNP